jgi:hypothetical protein
MSLILPTLGRRPFSSRFGRGMVWDSKDYMAAQQSIEMGGSANRDPVTDSQLA